MMTENSNAHKVGDVASVRSIRLVWAISMVFLCAISWSYFAKLDEVSSGSGRVVPARKEQLVQSKEGGIVAFLPVRENEIVDENQVLIQLDPTQNESELEEVAARHRAAIANRARLIAEATSTELEFPVELKAHPELIKLETELFHARRSTYNEQISLSERSLELLRRELAIAESLAKVGAASEVEVLKLQQQIAELKLKVVKIRSDYVVRSREDLGKVNSEIAAMNSVLIGRTDSLSRLTVKSPVRGIVKNIEVSTIGGVVAPNGSLMQIVPLDDQLLVEVRILPRDIAFIHPNQSAIVKVTAYDYSIYGGLAGTVVTISPDTIQDEVKPDLYYYRVFVKTHANALVNKRGDRFYIVPGMIATVDIKTGSKTVLDYIIKPFNRAKEALRER